MSSFKSLSILSDSLEFLREDFFCGFCFDLFKVFRFYLKLFIRMKQGEFVELQNSYKIKKGNNNNTTIIVKY